MHNSLNSPSSLTLYHVDVIDMYKRVTPESFMVFNYNPESTLWSASHRISMSEDCEAAEKPGELYVSLFH